MSDWMIVLLFVLVFGLLLFIVFRILRDAPLKEELHQLRVIERELRSQVVELKAEVGELDALKVIRARLESDLDHERSNAFEKIALLQQSELRLKTEFEHLAGRILQERGSSLGEENRVRMASLLQPFREQLDAFRTRVDEVHRNDTEISARLIEQVRQLQELSGKVSREANSLVQAIKGESKTQGDWGEMILENILERSGLSKGREYLVQGYLLDESGEPVKNDSGEIIEIHCTYDPTSKGGKSADGRKVKSTIHWVSVKHAVECEVR
ncbi:MAG: DNA recombination protein RmuC, partial [Chlorobiaceae bacterium]|nr:DNA recombination protein RmuC [Chlorobiaceae bacterium]